MPYNRSRSLLYAALTAVFIGYLTVWLPGPSAGLSFIGVELGEWIKFLGVGKLRNLFYLPPITLGLMLSAVTMNWPNRRWQTWAGRALAVGVALLAFPAIEAIRFESPSEWALRLELIGLVLVVAVLSSWRPSWLARRQLSWLLLFLSALAGLVLPTFAYLRVRPLVAQAIGLPLGIGLGVWLNGTGHLLIVALSLAELKSPTKAP
jgi:hypothetical protein